MTVNRRTDRTVKVCFHLSGCVIVNRRTDRTEKVCFYLSGCDCEQEDGQNREGLFSFVGL